MSEEHPFRLPPSDRLTRSRSGRVHETKPAEPYTPGVDGTGAHAPLKHGVYSTVEITGRAAEKYDELVAVLIREDLWRESFASIVALAAIALTRAERAAAAIASIEAQLDAEGGSPTAGYLGRSKEAQEAAQGMDSLRRELHRCINQAQRLLAEIGASPRSLAAIAKDTGLARATRATAALRALDAHLEENHAGGELDS